jgi:hypothetical protein
MDRPALQRLLADLTAGRVDTIVVYKIDRLTRSLADFAKIVEILDTRGASFVSVTQQFNTTTSMGRLTLNVVGTTGIDPPVSAAMANRESRRALDCEEPPEAIRDIIRVWGVLNTYRPKGQTSWSKVLVRHGAEAREAIAAVLGMPAEDIVVREQTRL